MEAYWYDWDDSTKNIRKLPAEQVNNLLNGTDKQKLKVLKRLAKVFWYHFDIDSRSVKGAIKIAEDLALEGQYLNTDAEEDTNR
jgi:hypothetical protein